MKIKVRKNGSMVMIAQSDEDNLTLIEFLDNITGQVTHPNPKALKRRLKKLAEESPWEDGKGY